MGLFIFGVYLILTLLQALAAICDWWVHRFWAVGCILLFLDALVSMICWVKSSVVPPTQGFRLGIVRVNLVEMWKSLLYHHSSHSHGHSMTCIICNSNDHGDDGDDDDEDDDDDDDDDDADSNSNNEQSINIIYTYIYIICIDIQ